MSPSPSEACGRYLTFRDFVHCGETALRGLVVNSPRSLDTYRALIALAEQVLDPVIDRFGMIGLSHGFCSHALLGLIPGRIAPRLDQHCSHETDSRGRLVCSRAGAAVDFSVPDVSMEVVARWTAANTPFDRLYFYGAGQPIHVSHGPDHSRQFVEMRISNGRTIPRVDRSVTAFPRLA
jgi:hypothetical protein